MYYSEEVIEEVRLKSDILDIVSENVKLKRSGATYFGLCPFHNEKSPSFSVSPSKQMFYCFGCGAGGNVFSFVMKYQNYNFVEAVKYLAERAKITLPEENYSEEAKKNADLRATLLEINKKAARYFYVQLKSPNGANALQYLFDRGLNQEMIKHFGMGYSNKTSNDLYRYMKSEGYTDDVLKETGLFSYSEKGVYDKFWNRVMFPILDVNNRVIGFGGRIIGEGKPKYLNSPDTKVFAKGNNLFALNYAKMSRKDYLLVCEGYMDAIALHRAGFTNAVASLGTAFTPMHANLMKRYVKSVILTFDSDGAGREAALRAIPILKKAGISMKVINMTPYKDPDEFIKNLGPEEFQKRIDQAQDSFLFEIEIISHKYDTGEVGDRVQFYKEIARKLLEFSDDFERNVYLAEISHIYDIPEEYDLKGMVRKLALVYEKPEEMEEEDDAPPTVEEMTEKKKRDDGVSEAQKMMLTWMIEDFRIYSKIHDIITEDDFINPLYHKVAKLLFEQFREGNVNPGKLLSHFTEPDEQSKVADLLNTFIRGDMSETEKEKAINELVKLVKKNSIDYREKNTKDIGEFQKLIDERKKLEKIYISL